MDVNKDTTIHINAKPHQCKFCDKTFIKYGNLIRHVRIHTVEKPFKCSSCNEAFSVKNDMIQHIHTHKMKVPYGCNQCDMTFIVKEDMISHISTHTRENIDPTISAKRDLNKQKNLRNLTKFH